MFHTLFLCSPNINDNCTINGVTIFVVFLIKKMQNGKQITVPPVNQMAEHIS